MKFIASYRFIALVIFLISSMLTIYITSPYGFIFFTFIMLAAFSSLFPIVMSRKILAKVVFSTIIFLIIYGFYLQYIVSLELWGDEIGVIQIAGNSFLAIRDKVSTLHATVPPLDYWILHVWKVLVAVSPDKYHEFIYRIPYIIMHGVAAIVFALLVEKSCVGNTSKISTMLLFFLAFITYIFHPLLFPYSIEVRFYAMAALGSVIALSLFMQNRFFSLRYYPLLLIFCLNSIFQFIILLPYIVYGLLYTTIHRRSAIILSVSLLVLFVLIYPLLHIYPGIGYKASSKGILDALSHFRFLQFNSNLQLVAAGCMLLFEFLRNKNRFSLWGLLSILGFYITSVVVLAYTTQYFAFHVRHLVFTMPLVLYFLFLPLMKTQGTIQYIFMILFAVFFTIPWVQKTNTMITTHDLFSKILMGSKKLAQVSKKNSLDVIITPNTGPPALGDEKIHYIDSVKWYLRTYTSAKIVHAKSQNDVCHIVKTDKHFIVYSINDKIDCLSRDFQIQYIEGSIVYLPSL